MFLFIISHSTCMCWQKFFVFRSFNADALYIFSLFVQSSSNSKPNKKIQRFVHFVCFLYIRLVFLFVSSFIILLWVYKKRKSKQTKTIHNFQFDAAADAFFLCCSLFIFYFVFFRCCYEYESVCAVVNAFFIRILFVYSFILRYVFACLC